MGEIEKIVNKISNGIKLLIFITRDEIVYKNIWNNSKIIYKNNLLNLKLFLLYNFFLFICPHIFPFAFFGY